MTMKASMLSSLPLGRIAIILVAVAAATNVLIAATGNMHTGLHHPAWVNVLSGVFAVCVWSLLPLGVVAFRRRRHRRTVLLDDGR
jgi:hypothetical protein